MRLGNLEAVRDWGHARDYCKAYYLMMDKASNDCNFSSYIVATGQCSSVRDFCQQSFQQAGFFNLKWSGQGLSEKLKGHHKSTQSELTLVEVSAEFFRPGEVPFLRGDSTRIRQELGWEPETKGWQDLANEML